MSSKYNILFFLGLIPFVMTAQQKNCVNIFQLSAPYKINPLFTSNIGGRVYLDCIYSKLMEFDPNTLEFTPQLANAYPKIDIIDTGKYKGGMSITFEIKPDAQSEDGKAVLPEDYIFTVKILKMKPIRANHFQPINDFIDSIIIDRENSRQFTIFSKKRLSAAVELCGDLHIIPQHIFDPQNIIGFVSFEELNENFNEIEYNYKLLEFCNNLNNENTISGSGPYQLKAWEAGHILLVRKKAWWGDKGKNFADSSFYYPDSLLFKFIDSEITAYEMAENRELDILNTENLNLFTEPKTKAIFSDFNFVSTNNFSSIIIGINTKNPKLNDKNTRLALAHLIDRDYLIKQLFEGFASKINSPISPMKYYHKKGNSIDFNIDKANKLLLSSGWGDSDKNGILDKNFDGNIQELSLHFFYNEGNEIRKQIGKHIKTTALKAGIKIELKPLEWSTFLNKINQRDYELYCGGLSNFYPGLDNLKEFWHSGSPSNRTGFGNAESDALLDAIENELDENKLIKLYYRLQNLIYNEQPCIFLFSPKSKIILHKSIDLSNLTSRYPGYCLDRLKMIK